MKVFEIYFDDLTKEAQEALLKEYETSVEDENWDIFPITGIQAFSRLAQAQTPAMSNLSTSTHCSHQRCILGHIELVIFSFLGHQLIMCAFFQDRSLVHIHDAGRIFNCGKTMCDDEGGTSLQQFI